MRLLTRLAHRQFQRWIGYSARRNVPQGDPDIYIAIQAAYKCEELLSAIARPACLAALMGTTFKTTNALVRESGRSIQKALLSMKEDATTWDPQSLNIAFLRFYTDTSEHWARHYLFQAGKNGVEEAIRLAEDDWVITCPQKAAAAAQLLARFDMEWEEAMKYIECGGYRDPYGDAVRQARADGFTESTDLARQNDFWKGRSSGRGTWGSYIPVSERNT